MFGSSAFGWPYIAALPEETYVYIPPVVVDVPVTTDATAQADLYQGGALVPVTEIKKKTKRVPLAIEPLLPTIEELLDDDLEVISASDSEIIEIDRPKPSVDPYVPDKPVEKPARKPVVPVSDEVREYEYTREKRFERIESEDKARMLKLSEDDALLGEYTNRKVMEDFALLEDDL